MRASRSLTLPPTAPVQHHFCSLLHRNETFVLMQQLVHKAMQRLLDFNENAAAQV